MSTIESHLEKDFVNTKIKKGKTTEQFKREVYDLVKDEYIVLSEYIKSSIKIKIKHNECSRIYEVSPNCFLSGNRCPYCVNNKKRKTTEQFKREVYDLVKDEYIVLSKYINSHTKIKMKHIGCGHVYEVLPNNFLSGNRCPICFSHKRKTTEQFKKEIYNLVKDEYVVLSEYTNRNTKIKMKHKGCGHVYEILPNNFLSGNRCPICFSHKKKTTEQFKEEIYNLVKDEYVVLSEYINRNTKVKIKHTECSYIYEVLPSNFLSGNRCPMCANKKKRKTMEQFKEEVYNLVKDEYVVLSEYINSTTKIKMKHIGCGHIYEVLPSNFLSGNRCPMCANGKRREFLTQNNR